MFQVLRNILFRSREGIICIFLSPYHWPFDLDITVGSILFPCHSWLLSAKSPLFKSTITELINQRNSSSENSHSRNLNWDFQETKIKPETFRLVLDHCYGGHIDIAILEIEELLELYYFARKYQFVDLEHIVVEQLKILKNFHFPVNEDSFIVYLMVENVQFICHNCILAANSDYFCVLFYGLHNHPLHNLHSGDPSGNEFELKGEYISPKIFRVYLDHLYKGQADISNLQFDELLDLFKFAHAFAVADFKNFVNEQLCTKFQPERLWEIYFKLKDFPETSLLHLFCHNFIDRDGANFLESDLFLELPKAHVLALLEPDYFCAEEIDIFRAVGRWIAAHHETEVEELYSLVRFPNMTWTDIEEVVDPTGVLSPFKRAEVDHQKRFPEDYDFKHRGYLSIFRFEPTKVF